MGANRPTVYLTYQGLGLLAYSDSEL